MNKLISQFLDRLAERLTALLASSISSRVEGCHAADQAEQQSQLEELARKYEAEGKPDIADALRQRVLRLTSTDLVAEAAESIQRLTDDNRLLPDAGAAGSRARKSNTDLQQLPDFGGAAPAAGKKRRVSKSTSDPASNSGEVQ